MSWEKTHRQQKLDLMADYPFCNWCKKRVRDYGLLPKGQRQPHDEATLDHLVSRFYRKKGERVKKVLACYRCNQQRSKIENKMFAKKNKGVVK